MPNIYLKCWNGKNYERIHNFLVLWTYRWGLDKNLFFFLCIFPSVCQLWKECSSHLPWIIHSKMVYTNCPFVFGIMNVPSLSRTTFCDIRKFEAHRYNHWILENSIGKKIKDEMKIKWENEQAHSVNIARQGRYAKKQQVPKLLPFVQQAFFCFNLFFSRLIIWK